MRTISKLVGAAGLALSWVAWSGQASAECAIQRYDMIFGADQSHYMRTGRNEPCKVAPTDGWLSFGSDDVPAPIHISSIRIQSRARFGIAGTDGSSFYAYKPNPGFVGKDEFVVMLAGTNGRTSGIANIKVEVTVSP